MFASRLDGELTRAGAGAALACGIETFAAATLAAAIPAPDKNFRRTTSSDIVS
jgi:hypothetical protein